MTQASSARADIDALHALIAESKQLREDMHAEQAQQRWRFRWMLVFLGVLCVAVAGLTTLVFQNQRIARSTQAISAQIADCTNQGGACWDESRQRSKTNVTSILNSTVFVAECLQRFPEQPTQEEQLEECVRRELATGRQPVPVPTPSAAKPTSPPTSGASR